MADQKEIKMHKTVAIVRNVEVVTVDNGVQKTRALTGEELEQWKKEHGYVETDTETESDT